MDINSRISALKGVGEKTEKLFDKLHVYTIKDLLSLYPRSYEVYEPPVAIREAEEGKTVAISGVVFGRVQTGGSRNMQITTIYVKDITGTMKVIWFRMPFLKNTLSKAELLYYGGGL